jgi:hypothetical protein
MHVLDVYFFVISTSCTNFDCKNLKTTRFFRRKILHGNFFCFLRNQLQKKLLVGVSIYILSKHGDLFKKTFCEITRQMSYKTLKRKQ